MERKGGSKKQQKQNQKNNLEEEKKGNHNDDKYSSSSNNKKSKNQSQKSQASSSNQQAEELSIYEKNGKIFITIRAKPGSKSDEIYAVEPDYIGVAVQAPPRDGEANDGILEFLGQVIGVKKRDLTLVKGQKGHDKVVQIDQPTSGMTVDSLMMTFMASKS